APAAAAAGWPPAVRPGRGVPDDPCCPGAPLAARGVVAYRAVADRPVGRQYVGCQYHRGGSPGALLVREVLAVSELPAGPVAAVLGPQELDLLEQFDGLVAVPDCVQGDRQLTGFGTRHPRLVADAAHAETGHYERVPAALEHPLSGRAAHRSAEHRVIPVHREPALVSERLAVAGHCMPEQRG